MNIDDFIYILSDEFDYSKVIASDVGPAYAIDMGLKYDGIREIKKYLDSYIIIDNRISEAECKHLKVLIEESKSTFIFKIVDPYKQNMGSYEHFLLEISEYLNVKYLSTYHLTEMTADLLDKVGKDRIVHIPYAFNPDKIVADHSATRVNKILLSGANFKYLYPLRRKLTKEKFRVLNFNLRRYTDVLQHPGYPDIGDKEKHDIVGSAYLKLLSGYKFMLVTPSVYSLEFLKYNECAYAGCVPVGLPASSLPKEAHDQVILLDVKKNLGGQVKEIVRSKKDYEEMAMRYRKAMMTERDKQKLQKILFDFVRD